MRIYCKLRYARVYNTQNKLASDIDVHYLHAIRTKFNKIHILSVVDCLIYLYQISVQSKYLLCAFKLFV